MLHETPTLDRDAIRTALAPAPPVTGSILPPAFQALSAADLAEQVEQIKIVPETLNIEELSKLWSAFQANHYRLTTAYQASTVLIESRKSTRSAPPVLKRKLYVVPLQRPVVDTVRSTVEPPDDPRITPTTTLASGARICADRPRSCAWVTAWPRPRRSPGRAGDHGGPGPVDRAARRHPGRAGAPRSGHGRTGSRGHSRPVVESNVAPFVLQPTVTVPATVAGPVGALAVTFTPAVGKGQRVTLVLYEFDAPTSRAACVSPGSAFPRTTVWSTRYRDEHRSFDFSGRARRYPGRRWTARRASSTRRWTSWTAPR
ncbi:MAG: Pvc16 family protein [Caldilineaceae bacterium]